jgi:hypothetical protein
LGSYYISTFLLQDGKVDFEGYINFNDAGAEYKFTISQNGREYAAGATAGTITTSGILKFNCWLL